MKVKKQPAIICDMDDVIFSFSKTICLLHNQKYKTTITEKDIISWNFIGLNILDAQGKRVNGDDLQKTFKFFEDHGLYAVLPLEDYVDSALQIIRSFGYKIIFLTARDIKYQIQTELSLIQHDLIYDEIIYSPDKVKIIRELAKKYEIYFFIDDRSETVKNVSEQCKIKKCYLMNKPHNQNINLDDYDINRVDDLMDCLKDLKKIK